ncbi:tRNA lysidine(34) synthetase TilS [Kiritimatiellota bacterium B12222]|nr:tRNA lysidine(34) synthetase TilS [Kiritimatiellota bacterium B12222]
MSFISSFVQLAQHRSFFPREVNRVVVACSGGPDSLFLLYLLWAVREELRLELSVLTCDHGLRPESAKEVHEVRQRAWTLGLPCLVQELDVPQQQQTGESIEMAARRLRRKAYLQAASEVGADRVALGHHLDDQAETILLKLARGTGPRGAGGMDWLSPLNESVSILRPLLSTRRSEIESCLSTWGIRAIHDASNQDDRYLRNRVRHEILPLMKERLNPAVIQHLAAFADQQRKLDAWVSHEAQERGKSCLVDGNLCVESWRFLPEVLQERILMGWLQSKGADVGVMGLPQFNEILQDLNRQVPHARRWEIAGAKIRVDQNILSEDTALKIPEEQTLTCPGRIWWEPLQRPLQITSALSVDVKASQARDFNRTLTAFMKPPPVGQSLHLRSPQPGDHYQPLGMKGRAKLSDLFINQQLPAKVRPIWPVILCGDEIVWVPGFRVADQWRAGPADCVKLELG